MRANDRDLDAVARAARAYLYRRRSGTSVDGCGHAGDETVGAGGRYQGHARRQPIAANARGNGHRAEVEQIDEVGVGPEPGIEADGIGLDLGDGVGARHGRNDHRVEFGPHAARLPLLIGEPVEGLERGNSIKPARALDVRAGDGMQSLWIALDQRLHRGVPLSDPWPLVERAGNGGERLEVELDDARAKRFSELKVARKSR